MHAWEQIQQTIEYMEEHIADDLKIEDLAKKTSFSEFHFQRLFRRLIKKPISEYITLRRMAKAANLLLEKRKNRILDIALELGFSSRVIFSRTFKETFGITPDEYRKNPIALQRMTKPQLLLSDVPISENVPLVIDGMILEVGRKRLTEADYFAGISMTGLKRRTVGTGTELGLGITDVLWQKYHEKKTELQDVLCGSDEIGILCDKEGNGDFSYFVGGEVHSDPSINGFEVCELPKGDYIVCSIEAEDFEDLVMNTMYKEFNYLNNIWFTNHNITIKSFSAERFIHSERESIKMELWFIPE